MGAFEHLPTLAEVQAARAGQPVPKGRSRLEVREAADKLTVVDDRAFRLAVCKRDGYRCRVCGRKTVITLKAVATRCEVHHLHGRRGHFRFEDKHAVCTCLKCHKRLTGQIGGHRLVALGTKHITTAQGTFIDARAPIVWREIP